ncbi:TPA: DUF4373 domain-containing protein [Elizabethkingia anophelis]|nr:DUF4373 domain-containing protein [Elizabethkingia anophelis]
MSNKEAYYFSHDSNARQDEKVIALRMKHGWEGYGLYWALIEKLRECRNYMSVCDYNVIAYDLRTDSAKIKSIIEDFRLFAFTDIENVGKCFYSESLKSRMDVKDSKSEKARELAALRWGAKPERQKAKDHIFYIIEIFNGEERFLKCGITSDSVSRRYSGKLSGYNYKLVFQKDLDKSEAIRIEGLIGNSFENYLPSVKFAGYLECYKYSCLDSIIDVSGFRNDFAMFRNANKEKKSNNIINKLLFVSITNLNDSIQSFRGNKSYFFLAYRFWELWKKENPNHKHLEKAEAYDWVDTIRLIVETDKQTTKRLVGVLEYFRKCASKDTRFRDFWYKTIKSIKALRNVDKNGVKYIDSIAEDLNDAMDKHEDFKRLVMSNIKKLQDYESNKSPA